MSFADCRFCISHLAVKAEPGSTRSLTSQSQLVYWCIALRVTGQRLSEILNGAMFTAEECSRAAEVVGIPVATLEDTGACRRHEKQPVSNNHQGSHL